MKGVSTFGEIMLRLSPLGREALFQSPWLMARFGGGEANVAVSLAVLGHSSRFISVIPANDVGDAALREIHRWGVDTSWALRRGSRLGIYFAEIGANQRPSQVIYDRLHSSISEAGPGDIDWESALAGTDWFHVTGITPALSVSASALTLEAVQAAKARGLTVSVDLNYRAKLWKYGLSPLEVMPGIVQQADVVIGNEEDFQKSLGLGREADVVAGRIERSIYEELTDLVLERFPALSLVAVTLRESRSADDNGWSACLRNRTAFLAGTRYDIAAVVDRIGAGDAFSAGLIHGLDLYTQAGEALEFAIAASCLKHSYPGDFNPATEPEIQALMTGERSGRIRR